MAARLTPLGRPLPRGDRLVSSSTFAFLFAELISYLQARVTSMSDLEARLEAAGAGLGARFLELAAFREKPGRRETSVVAMLQFISGAAWQSLFGKHADALEKSTETANQYMIREDEPLTNAFISMPKEYSRVNVAAFTAGIIKGMLDAASFVRRSAGGARRARFPLSRARARSPARAAPPLFSPAAVHGEGRHRRRARRTARPHRFRRRTRRGGRRARVRVRRRRPDSARTSSREFARRGPPGLAKVVARKSA